MKLVLFGNEGKFIQALFDMALRVLHEWCNKPEKVTRSFLCVLIDIFMLLMCRWRRVLSSQFVVDISFWYSHDAELWGRPQVLLRRQVSDWILTLNMLNTTVVQVELVTKPWKSSSSMDIYSYTRERFVNHKSYSMVIASFVVETSNGRWTC